MRIRGRAQAESLPWNKAKKRIEHSQIMNKEETRGLCLKNQNSLDKSPI